VRYSTRVLLLQLTTVVAVVAVCAGVFSWIAYDRLRDEAATTAMGIARSVAASPQVREALAEGQEPSVDGALQSLAEDATESTGALFVVVSDANGIRLGHPEPERLGETVSTDYEPVLRGEEVTAWESGTLGPSARAKTPVYAPGQSAEDGARPVGGVSVGFLQSGVFDDLPRLLAGVGAAAAGALVLGAAVSLVMRRRWERVTLGLQPEEMTELVRAQSAVLDGVEDGVLSVDTEGVVQVINPRARELLDCGDMVGRPVAELNLPDDTDPAAPLVRGDRVLYVDSRLVRRDDRDLGTVIVVRDRTDIETLSRRLGTVQAMGGALRVQRHEFANRIHVATGLLDAGRTTDARDFLGEMADRGPVDFPLENAELLSETFLQSFLGAKSTEAAEKSVTLRIGEDTLVVGTIAPVSAVEDVATVLGNLVDNAVTAAVAGAGAGDGRWVEVSALQDADSLTLVVADSGAGVGSGDGGADVAADGADPVHGHGIGLALSRDLLRRRGGELWLIDAGGEGTGAVFGARLPGVMTTRGEGDDGHDE